MSNNENNASRNGVNEASSSVQVTDNTVKVEANPSQIHNTIIRQSIDPGGAGIEQPDSNNNYASAFPTEAAQFQPQSSSSTSNTAATKHKAENDSTAEEDHTKPLDIQTPPGQQIHQSQPSQQQQIRQSQTYISQHASDSLQRDSSNRGSGGPLWHLRRGLSRMPLTNRVISLLRILLTFAQVG
ncbi:hypothetical protein BX070DRAFT_234204 [Coemansia spiralis]|nr:hypothetical protein BX070DRAFT_234204 [Coemansia spiralis]